MISTRKKYWHCSVKLILRLHFQGVHLLVYDSGKVSSSYGWQGVAILVWFLHFQNCQITSFSLGSKCVYIDIFLLKRCWWRCFWSLLLPIAFLTSNESCFRASWTWSFSSGHDYAQFIEMLACMTFLEDVVYLGWLVIVSQWSTVPTWIGRVIRYRLEEFHYVCVRESCIAHILQMMPQNSTLKAALHK